MERRQTLIVLTTILVGLGAVGISSKSASGAVTVESFPGEMVDPDTIARLPRAGEISGEQAFEQAGKSAEIAGYSLSKVHRWLHEQALKQIDPATGLYKADDKWNYCDTAADCYPFLVWAAYVVDAKALNGPVRDILHTEMKLCNHTDRIPVPWDFGRNAKQEDLSWDRVVYEASEYVKDGLIAIVEVTGKDEWFARMKGIEEDLWKHAKIDTPYGKIPSTNVEINGEQLQALARLYTMTGEKNFLTWAERLGDYYLTKGDCRQGREALARQANLRYPAIPRIHGL